MSVLASEVRLRLVDERSGAQCDARFRRIFWRVQFRPIPRDKGEEFRFRTQCL